MIRSALKYLFHSLAPTTFFGVFDFFSIAGIIFAPQSLTVIPVFNNGILR